MAGGQGRTVEDIHADGYEAPLVVLAMMAAMAVIGAVLAW